MADGLIEPVVQGNTDKISAAVARWAAATMAIEQLSQARSLDDLVAVLRIWARRVVGADGIAVVLREGGRCHYVAEDSFEPLWTGQRFPAETCVSGWAMMNGQTAAIPDIFRDPRVPVDAYRETFVRSMLMVPIGRPEPVAAVGAYWSMTGQPSENEVALLEALARAASAGLENGRLLTSLERLNTELEDRVAARTIALERAHVHLREKQKMEVIGQLTGNVAHDFNNLLAPIMSSLDLVLAGRAKPEAILRTAGIAMEAAEAAKTLVQRLLAFARRQPLLTAAIDPVQLIGDLRGLLASSVGSQVTLETRAAPDLPAIRADKHQLEMAILNLVVNARDATPDGGTITVSAEKAGADRPEVLGDGAYVQLVVSDTGSGMDEKTKGAATEPFFTTKEPGRGTGLGLSMVDGLIRQLGGVLAIDSAPGKGTAIRLFLPVIAEEKADAQHSAADELPRGGRGRVLLVEDDALVRMSTNNMLEDLGFEVVEREDAHSALAAIDDGLEPDVVVTDHLMPGMTGAEFALRLRTDYPNIAVVIVSGYQGIDLIAPDIVRVSKPFRQAHLDASIGAALGQLHPLRV